MIRDLLGTSVPFNQPNKYRKQYDVNKRHMGERRAQKKREFIFVAYQLERILNHIDGGTL